MQTSLLTCPQCGSPAKLENAAFCPFCGAAMPSTAARATPDGAREALKQAEKQANPQKKHELLLKAERDYPDCLEIEEELLFLGRLYERNARSVDYSVIKCYLFQMYLEPFEFKAERRAEMSAELFEHPRLLKCQELSQNPDLYLRKYLERLAGEFIHLFLRGNNRYMQSFFGITVEGRAPKLLAGPTATMLHNIRKDEQLSPERRTLLYTALYRGYAKQMRGETKWLDEMLAADGCPLPGGG